MSISVGICRNGCQTSNQTAGKEGKGKTEGCAYERRNGYIKKTVFQESFHEDWYQQGSADRSGERKSVGI